MTPASRSRRSRHTTVAERVLADEGATLLDVVDNVLTKGVVLTGDVLIGLAHVDLVYARVSLLLCAADRVRPGEDPDPIPRIQNRRAARMRRAAAVQAIALGVERLSVEGRRELGAPASDAEARKRGTRAGGDRRG